MTARPRTAPVTLSRTTPRPGALRLALSVALTLPTVFTAVPAEAGNPLVDAPITFEVINRNTSPVPAPDRPARSDLHRARHAGRRARS